MFCFLPTPQGDTGLPGEPGNSTHQHTQPNDKFQVRTSKVVYNIRIIFTNYKILLSLFQGPRGETGLKGERGDDVCDKKPIAALANIHTSACHLRISSLISFF